MLIAKVTRWRPAVQDALNKLRAMEPGLFTVLGTVNVSIDQLTEILLGIIQRESGGNPNAHGDAGCSYGLMQFNVCVHQIGSDYTLMRYPFDLGNGQFVMRVLTVPEDLFDPTINLAIGSRLFLRLVNQFHEITLSVLAYNAGARNTERYVQGEIQQPINQGYLDAWLAALDLPADFFDQLKQKAVQAAPGLLMLGVLIGILLLLNSLQTSGKGAN